MTYRNNDPVSGRWSGIGADLSAFQIDSNFYELVTRVATLESNTKFTVSISYITITGNDITFHMTDHTTQGPFTIPPSTFHDRGTWQPTTPYLVNDTFNINGTLYLVIFAHTSAATFDPNANDGAGHNYYKAMISVPGNALPTGGTTGQALSKSSNADYATTWSDKLPTGGTTGQFLGKNSNTNQDASWKTFAGVTAPPPSPAGAPGDALITNDGTSASTGWETVIYAPPPSPAGAPGDVPYSVDGTPTNMGWMGVATASQFLSDQSGLLLTTDKVWSAAVPVALTDAATVAVDMSTFINASVTLGGNRMLGNPTNMKPGQSGFIEITQDGTGSRTLAYGSSWKFESGTAPTLSTAAGANDILFYQVLTTNAVFANLIKAVA